MSFDMFLEPPPIVAKGSSLDFLQVVYRCTDLPLSVRMRAAMAALPYEHPKLAVTVALTEDNWAARLQACIARSRPVLELHAAEPSSANGAAAVSAASMHRPMTLIRRR